MHEEIIIAGFGGQGVMLLGKFLSEAAMEENKQVSWLPSYGPEMRGGTANCHVIISDEPIASPVIVESTMLVAMNRPSLEKFQKTIKKGGALFINSSIIDIDTDRSDVIVYKIPVNDIANKIGSQKIINMVMCGAMIQAKKLVSIDTMINVFKENLTGSKEKFIDLNISALREGMKYFSENYKS
ncbi:MAG TPA: 2-oxoacid:acceptor oxidoreductase family protein [Exilispira sp.]|jgi:2-oxoglutarate ferredoxin oxidoreductase subunit gamma|nr:2-oxoacid:acceptor oxidoreductase family protein [Exilispira sp.]